MGFPTKNPDGSPFRNDDEYIKCLELEIESLRSELADERMDIEKLNTLLNEACSNAALSQGERDEWERRAHVVWESHQELGREVADWFEEE